MANTELSYADMDDEAFEASLSGDADFDSEQEASSDASEPEIKDEAELDTEESEGELTDEEDVSEAEEEPDTVTEEEDELDADESDDNESESDQEEVIEPDDLGELYKPFKASGREVSVKSIEEARKLMSMGVDYSNKLQGFKQHRKTIKTLETNKIDMDQLNYLIDLSSGNPQAIAKLLREKDIDPLDLDTEEDSSYKPSDYSVSDAKVELDDVISRIQDSESFSTTADILTNQWDESSKQAFSDEPSLIEKLNTQVANGTYERIMQEVDRARLFGGLQGLSDLEAYDQVGRTLTEAEVKEKPKSKVIKTAPKKTVTNQDRKLRASSSKSTPTPKKATPKWSLTSDDEFEKLLKGGN